MTKTPTTPNLDELTAFVRHGAETILSHQIGGPIPSDETRTGIAKLDAASSDLDKTNEHVDDIIDSMKVLSANLREFHRMHTDLLVQIEELEKKQKLGDVADRLFAQPAIIESAKAVGVSVSQWAVQILTDYANDSIQSSIPVTPDIAERFAKLAAARGKSLRNLTTSRTVSAYIKRGFDNIIY